MTEKISKAIYPRVYSDEGGLKFVFDHNAQHYTLRFAGRPMFLIEKQYELLGGTNFKYIYNLVKSTDWKSEPQNDDTAKQISILMKASKRVTEMLNLIKAISDDKHPPVVVYAKDYLPL